MKKAKNTLEPDFDVKYKWFLPYRWKWKSAFLDIWNSKDDRIFPPKQFGFGWGVNLHALTRLVTGEVKKRKAKKKKSSK